MIDRRTHSYGGTAMAGLSAGRGPVLLSWGSPRNREEKGLVSKGSTEEGGDEGVQNTGLRRFSKVGGSHESIRLRGEYKRGRKRGRTPDDSREKTDSQY